MVLDVEETDLFDRGMCVHQFLQESICCDTKGVGYADESED